MAICGTCGQEKKDFCECNDKAMCTTCAAKQKTSLNEVSPKPLQKINE